MCNVEEGVYVSEAPGCAALETRRPGPIRHGVVRYLHGEPAECVAVTELVVDELLTIAFEHEPGAARLQVQRRPRDRACWIELSGCSGEVARWADSPHRTKDLRLLILDTACTAWGAIRGATGYTLWAEVSLVPEA